MRLRIRRTTLQKFARFPRFFYFRFIRLHTSTEEMARGVAIGLFIGMTPTSPFQMILAIALAALFNGNQLLAALLTWITNPLTSVPIYGLAYWIGRFFLQGPPLREVLEHEYGLLEVWLKMGWRFFGTVMFGGLILGLVAGVIGYYVSIPIYRRVREKRIEKLRRRQLRAHLPVKNLPGAE